MAADLLDTSIIEHGKKQLPKSSNQVKQTV